MQHVVKFLSLIFVLLLLGCGPNYILDKKYEIENSEWTYRDTLNFEVNITDSLKIYNLYLQMEHSTDFPRQNMYVRIHTKFPSGKRISEQVSLEMANKAGVWYGNCNREWCRFTLPIQQGAYFDLPGDYEFTVEQYMRIDPLPGLKSLAFKVEDTGLTR